MPQKRDWKGGPGSDSTRGDDAPKERAGETATSGGGRIRPTAVIAVAIAVGLLAWLLIQGGDDSSSESNQPPSKPKVVSESGLLGALRGTGYPIYWAGPRAGVEYEVSRPSPDRTFIRYLPKGEEAGTKKRFLTVGNYRQPSALGRIVALGQGPGAVLVRVGGGAAYAEGPNTTSAYLAFPDVDTEIEVFDPKAGEALKLIRSGAIIPVG
jgi:hypothetical protein